MEFLRLHRFAVPTLMLGAFWASSQTHAQFAEARRYTSVQGIEMIQSRGSPMRGATAAAGAVGDTPARAISGGATGLTTSPPPGANRVRVSFTEQAARDRERMAVLKLELNKELARLQELTTVLKSPELRQKTAPDEIKRLEYMKELHRQNLKALTAEIQRAGR